MRVCQSRLKVCSLPRRFHLRRWLASGAVFFPLHPWISALLYMRCLLRQSALVPSPHYSTCTWVVWTTSVQQLISSITLPFINLWKVHSPAKSWLQWLASSQAKNYIPLWFEISTDHSFIVYFDCTLGHALCGHTPQIREGSCGYINMLHCNCFCRVCTISDAATTTRAKSFPVSAEFPLHEAHSYHSIVDSVWKHTHKQMPMCVCAWSRAPE